MNCSLRNFSIFPVIVLALGLMSSCSSDDPGSVESPQPVNEDIDAGNRALETELYAMINSDNIDSPDDMDFTKAKAYFESAVRKNPANLHGHFGLSLTSLLSLSADPEINAAFDEWETYLENNTPFQGSGKALNPLGIPLTFASDNRNMELPLDILAHSLLIGADAKVKVNEPSIGRIQDIFRDRVIPVLEKSASHLGRVAEDPDYVFWVTPVMLGDAEEDSLELDLTEILAARAGVLLLTSVCRMAVAYDLSFSSYDAAGIVSGLDYTNGTMLRLRDDGEAQMRGVESDFLSAVNDLDSGIIFLMAETDNQDNDIIKIDPGDLSRNDLLDFRVNELADARDLFGDGLVLTEDWDNSYMTPPVDLRINAHNFFQNPISDWKMVLPPYTVTTVEVEDGWHPRDYDIWTSFNTNNPGHAEGGCRIWVQNSQATRDSVWGSTEISNLAMSEASWVVRDLGWYQYNYQGYVTISGSGEFAPGYNQLILWVDFELVSDAPTNVIPHVSWEADTFQDWKNDWGNFNFNGLLPEIGSNEELFNLFGFSESDWEKEFDLDWTDLD